MKKSIGLLFISLFLVGCTIAGQEEVRPLYVGSTKIIDQTKADNAKQIVLSMNEVIAVTGATYEEDIFLAAKVKQFDRLFLDRIRKDAFDKIKKRYPEAKVHVSTDKKVFLELEKLEIEIYEGNVEKTEIEKRWKRIEDFMKG